MRRHLFEWWQDGIQQGEASGWQAWLSCAKEETIDKGTGVCPDPCMSVLRVLGGLFQQSHPCKVKTAVTGAFDMCVCTRTSVSMCRSLKRHCLYYRSFIQNFRWDPSNHCLSRASVVGNGTWSHTQTENPASARACFGTDSCASASCCDWGILDGLVSSLSFPSATEPLTSGGTPGIAPDN